MEKKKNPVKEFLSKIGRKGGKAKGKAKVRGDSKYYSRISKLKKGVKS
jgi:general stress protein YciG